jgi:UDP-N-acetylglucosamine diphosphorylase / glucose-1-phosphate thymidylyltransferase / UDP-N-acetylgalactosamine diphosphorylase / glucosamine-1-phosphate N-acetyltransferase / galactosamine-1-phosphate N-acetyltransferase
MTTLVLYDDSRARSFEPFASTRPLAEMRAGTSLIRARWCTLFPPHDVVQFIAGPRLADFDEPGASHAASGTLPAGTIVANARFAPALPTDVAKAVQRAATTSLWRAKDRLAAVRLRAPIDTQVFADGTLVLDELFAGTGAISDLDGWWIEEVWDFIRHLPDQLSSDIERLARIAPRRTGPPPSHATVLGDHAVLVDADSSTVVEPHVVFDASAGPILVERGAHIRAFSRIAGPCYLGREVNVMGGDVGACAIGDVSKVRGEIANSVMLGHSNKGHDGFIGHSYMGRWVNIGAGTTTSNLKNTYGSVSLWTPSGVRDTGLQFLGTMFGDHVKTGIGLQITTGTVLGAGSNVYGAMPPKTVAPFSWGDGEPYSVYRSDKFCETASRMMSRRHVELTDRARKHLVSVHAARWTVERRA